MFSINDMVQYGSNGACQITEKTKKVLYGKTVEYYVLKPVYDDKLTFYVPIHHELSASKMRRILTVREIYEMIKSMPDQELIWFENENRRKESYKNIIADGNHTELVKLIKTLYMHKQKLQAMGKKMHKSDELFMKEAEKLLYEEFALVLNLNRDEVLPFILKQLEVPV